MTIHWLLSALEDLDQLHGYIAEDNAAAAARTVPRLREAVQELADFPERSRPGRWPGTRELVVPGTSYVVPYRIVGQDIEILRVMHGRRSWP